MKKDWLDLYVEFTKDFEPPPQFALWTGILTLSVAAGHRSWLEVANNRVYPNIYVVLVGPSGVGKGQAMREAIPFLDKAMVPKSPDVVTMPRLIEHMSESQQFLRDGTEITPYLLWAEELPSFLGMDAWRSGKLADLTTIFDCAPVWRKQTKDNGHFEIINPYMCMLAGSTPSGIYDVLPPASVGQGFTSRVIFVWADRYTKRVPLKPWTDFHVKAQAELEAGIEEIIQVQGPMQMDMYAQTMWADYYRFRPDPVEAFGDSRLQGFAARQPFYIMKMAVLMKLAERTPGNLIECHHIEKAKQLLDDVEDGMKRIYEEIAPSNIVRFYHKVVTYIANQGGIRVRHSDVLRKFQNDLNRKELAEVVGTLVDMGAIVEEQEITAGRPRRVYSLTNKMVKVLV